MMNPKTTPKTTLFALALILGGLMIPQIASAGLTGYLKIDDIPGESKRNGYEGSIDISGFSWGATNSAAQVGKGRTRARAQVDSFVVEKSGDSASVYLKLAVLQGKFFDRIELDVLNRSGMLKFRYVFENARIVAFDTSYSDGDTNVSEEIGIEFERVRVLYIETNDDGSAGDEHEITYDIAAGV